MRRIIKWVLIALILVVIGFAVYNSKSSGVEVDVLRVPKGGISQYLEDSAQVLAVENQTVYIEGTGKVTKINVNLGDAVKQGDLLLSLEKTDLELQLRDAEAKVEASRAQLKGTELINYANKIEQAKTRVDQTKVALDTAERSLANARKLYNSNAISMDEFEKAQDNYKAAVIALESANLQLEEVKQGAPEYLKNSYQAQLEQAIIHRDTILRSIKKQEVRAPIDGIVMEKRVEINTPVTPATPAFVIGNVNNLELEADILADDINKIKIGNEVEISGKPLDNTILKGKVIKIAPAAKTVVSSLGVNQKRVPVTIEITDEAKQLKPGFSVDIKIITDVKSDAIIVPDSSIFEYKEKSNVFLVENGKAVLRNVKRGVESGNSVEILEGLKEGDIILVKPDNTIKEGMKIKEPDEKH